MYDHERNHRNGWHVADRQPDCPLCVTAKAIAQTVEAIPAGETMVIDLGLRLAARPFDAERL